MSKIQEKKLKEVAKELYRGLKRRRLEPQINYDYEDGDIWIDWMTQGSWKEYHASTILQIPLDDILVMGMESETYINYEEGLKEAILKQIWIGKKYGDLR